MERGEACKYTINIQKFACLRDTVVYATAYVHVYLPGPFVWSVVTATALTSSPFQSSGGVKSLSLPVSGKVLSAIIEYMYTDEAPSIQGDDSLLWPN